MLRHGEEDEVRPWQVAAVTGIGVEVNVRTVIVKVGKRKRRGEKKRKEKMRGKIGMVIVVEWCCGRKLRR